MIIYLDAYLFVNFIMNYCLLDSQRKMLLVPKNVKRTILATVISTVLSVSSLFVIDRCKNYVLLPTYMLCCVLINRIHYGKSNLTFTLGSVLMTIISTFTTNALLFNVSVKIQKNNMMKTLTVIVICKYAVDLMYTFIRKYIHHNDLAKKEIYGVLTDKPINVFIEDGNVGVKAKAIVDTGNSLTDPYCKRPVAVISNRLYEKLKQKDKKIILIPFSSVGTEHGMLYGFIVDSIKILDKNIRNGEIIQIEHPILAAHKSNLSFENKYEILLNPKMLEGAIKNVM